MSHFSDSLGGIAAAVVAIVAAWAFLRGVRYQRALADERARLRDALESLAEGFALYDADERLVMCNSRYRDMYASIKGAIMPGARFEELLLLGARCGSCRGDPAESWVAERLNRFRHPEGPFEQQLSDGHWVRCTEYRTADGGTICLRADITDLKRVEQRLRDAINGMADGFVLYDAADDLVLSNDRFLRIYGYLDDGRSLTGRCFDDLMRPLVDRDLIVPDDGETPAQWFARRQRHHAAPSDQPFVIRFKDGRSIDVRERRTSEGGCVSICVDTTQSRMAQQALAASEVMFRGLLTASPDAMVVVGEDGNIILASERAEALFGYTRTEMVGMPLSELVPEEYRASHADFTADYFRRPRSREMGGGLRLFARRKDGSRFPGEISLSPYRMPDGLVVLAAVRDITARQRAEEALRQAQKMEALGTLASGIAHDLNNTLVPVLGMAKLAGDSLPPDLPEHELIADIAAAAARAKDLVDQILAFGRSDAPERTVIDLSSTIAAALRLVRPGIPPTVAVRADLPRAPTLILGNDTQIHQIIVNLCSNAADAIGGKIGEIAIVLSVEDLDPPGASLYGVAAGRYAHLTVDDSGAGMSEAVRERIFDPFFTTKPVGKGSGLGLAIVHGVVTAHGGGIVVKSTPGAGTRFDLVFPILSDRPRDRAGPAPEDKSRTVNGDGDS